MKAIVVYKYGRPEVLKLEDIRNRRRFGRGVVRVAASSVNPLDYKRRAGLTKDLLSHPFPRPHRGRHRGNRVKIGPEVEGFSIGDRVFSMADDALGRTLCREGRDLGESSRGGQVIEAAALPLATTTGNQLLLATKVGVGETVLVVGAVGNVGRSAVFTAKSAGRLSSRGY